MQFKVKGILSYPHLFEPRSVQKGDEPKYSTGLLIKKTDPQVEEIKKIINQDIAAGFPSGFPANGRQFLKDSKDYPDYYVINSNAKADSPPEIVDASLQPLMDRKEVRPGMVVWLGLNSFVYNQAVNKGIGCGLNAVMTTGEMGELGPLDNKPTAANIFGSVAGQSSPPVAPPAAPAAPPAAPLVMTAAANGMSYQQYKDAGWTDEQMLANGIASKPSFA